MTTPDSDGPAWPPANPYEPPKASLDPPADAPAGRLARRGAAARKSPPGVQFSLPCQCGLAVTVAAGEAGSTVQCDCGADVRVPSLGRLREMVGKAPYESGTADMIRRMVQTGELPAGRTCVVSRTPTDDVLEFRILVPRSFSSGKSSEQNALLYLWLFGPLVFLYISRFRPPKIEEGDAVHVVAPLRVSSRNHSRVRRMSEGRLKKLLRTVPVYAELLDENYLARVSVADDEVDPE
jgi:hypothetical protein